MSEMKARWTVAVHAFDARFDGLVDGRIYELLRIGLALLLLLRSADFTRPWLSLDHYEWVKGFDFSWSVAESPYLVSPLVPGLVLGARATWLLVRARFALALLLLFRIRLRWIALLLTLFDYALLFADRYRYFHHLQVLYLAIAWLTLSPTRPASGDDLRPAWPLQLLRSALLGIYFASGTAKLTVDWWSGDSLAVLAHLHQMNGRVWTWSSNAFGFGGLAKLVCFAELSLVLLLSLRATRRAGVVLGFVFHGLVSCVLPVSTFGATMALLLASFWPARKCRVSPPAVRARGTAGERAEDVADVGV